MRVSCPLSVFVPVMILGCGQRSESAAVQRLEPGSVSSVSLRTHSAVGCWNFAAVGYRGYARLPEFVQLSAKYRVTAQGDTIGQALLDADAKGPGLGFAYWIPINANTIDLSWSDGLTGVEVELVGR